VREISMPEDMETIEIRETGGGGGGGGGGGEMEKPWRFPDGNNGGKLNFSTLFGGEGPRLFHHSFTCFGFFPTRWEGVADFWGTHLCD